MTNGLVTVLGRKTGIVAAHPAKHSALRSIAANLDRRVADGATVELLTEALYRLVDLVYQADGAGLVNIDGVTGRILIPVPWGRAGRSQWGLYPSEADTLRSILRRRRRGGAAPLFVYDKPRRSWLVNLASYPTAQGAMAYLEAQPLTVTEYRLHYQKIKK